MKTTIHFPRPAEQTDELRLLESVSEQPEAAGDEVLSISELAAELRVPVKTLYDLRSKGRGPRGLRIGRELRFRRGEVDAWCASLEADDARRHPRPERS